MVIFRSLYYCCLLLATPVSSFVLPDAGSNGFGPPMPALSRKQQQFRDRFDTNAHNHEMKIDKNDGEDGEYMPATAVSRRSAIQTAVVAVATMSQRPPIAAAAQPNGLALQTAPSSGLRWADAKLGSGDPPRLGSPTSVDYSMASTAGRFPSIYSTKNAGAPYRWTLGDGSTIAGIELAVLGNPDEGIPPMRPGGIRRVIVPSALGFDALIRQSGTLSPTSKNQRCLPGAEGSIGPIPPKDAPDGAYQRWYQFYCNPRIPYQPDLVLDIKLYRTR